MSGPVEVVLILAAIGYVLARRLMGEPAQGRRLLILPAVLSLVGLSDVSAAATAGAWVALVTGVAVSIVLGALRGTSVRLASSDGIAVVRYTWVTVALWAANVAVKFGINAAVGLVDPDAAHPASTTAMFTLGLGMLAEGAVIYYRAAQRGQRVSWESDRGLGRSSRLGRPTSAAAQPASRSGSRTSPPNLTNPGDDSHLPGRDDGAPYDPARGFAAGSADPWSGSLGDSRRGARRARRAR